MCRRFAQALGHHFAEWRLRMGSFRVRLVLWYLTIMAALLLFFGALQATTLISLAQSYHDQLMLQFGERLAATYQAQTGQVHLEQQLPDAGDMVVVVGASGAVTQTVGPVSLPALAALRSLIPGDQDASFTETTSYPFPVTQSSSWRGTRASSTLMCGRLRSCARVVAWRR